MPKKARGFGCLWYNLYVNLHILRVLFLSMLSICALGLCIYGAIQYTSAEIAVEWTTASELDTVGFNVYRNSLAESDLIKVNSSLITASSNALIGGYYKFLDSDLIPNVEYSYYLEDIDRHGNATKHGPIVVVAQRGGKAELLIALLLIVSVLIGWKIPLDKVVSLHENK